MSSTRLTVMPWVAALRSAAPLLSASNSRTWRAPVVLFCPITLNRMSDPSLLVASWMCPLRVSASEIVPRRAAGGLQLGRGFSADLGLELAVLESPGDLDRRALGVELRVGLD